MFHNLTTYPGLTQLQHRALPQVSNTDLSNLKAELTLVDFKTTSCPTYAHFLTTIEQYDYDRQAALYLDALGATRFLIIGVQKKSPHEVWFFDATVASSFIQQGRKKYIRLLTEYARTVSSKPLVPTPH